jgi:hypothetical protein
MIKYCPSLLAYNGAMVSNLQSNEIFEIKQSFGTLFKIDLEFELLSTHERTTIGETILEGLLIKIVEKSKIQFQTENFQLKAILSLVSSLPKKFKKPSINSNDILQCTADGLLYWIHVSKMH